MQDSFTGKQTPKYRTNFKGNFKKFPTKGYQQQYVEKYEKSNILKITEQEEHVAYSLAFDTSFIKFFLNS